VLIAQGYISDVDPNVTSQLLQSMTTDIAVSGFVGSLIDLSNPSAYPILGLSYFIIETVNASGCDSVVELIRYINWTQSDPFSVTLSKKLRMATMPSELASLVKTDILMQITCDEGLNAYALLQQQVQFISLMFFFWLTESKIV